ncbi:MAG: hypothetical protein AMXMBFR84_25360 [Candidatus Hydrogenedentota bacterium]
MFSMPGGWEWIIIAFIVVVIFGAGKLPQAARSMGQAINEFKEGVKKKDDDNDKFAKSSTDESTHTP